MDEGPTKGLLGEIARELPAFRTVGRLLLRPYLLPLYLALFLWIAPALDAAVGVDPMSIWASLTHHLGALIQNPWIQAGYFILAFYAIFWAARRIEKRDAEALAAETANRATALNEFRNEFGYLRDLPKMARLAREIQIAKGVHREVINAVRRARHILKTIKRDYLENAEANLVDLVMMLQHVSEAAGGLGLECPHRPPSISIPPQVCDQVDNGAGVTEVYFVPERNQSLIQQIRDYVDLVESWSPKVDELLQSKRAELEKLALGGSHE